MLFLFLAFLFVPCWQQSARSHKIKRVYGHAGEGSTTGRRQRLSKESSQTVRPRFAVRAPFVAVPPAAFTSGVTVAANAPMSFSKKLVVTCVVAVAKEISHTWLSAPLWRGQQSPRGGCSMCSLQCPDPQAQMCKWKWCDKNSWDYIPSGNLT